MPTSLQSSRLILRQWSDNDLATFAEMNADSEVMRYFPKPLSTLESDAMANKIRNLIEDNGWGFWAVSRKQAPKEDFIGFVGLHQPTHDLPFTPCVEIGWRLHKDHWGKGYATEAAAVVLNYAFDELGLDEVVSFTSETNIPSQAVMQRIGMVNTQQNFDHPALDPDHPLAHHVLYKMTKQQWLSKTRACSYIKNGRKNEIN